MENKVILVGAGGHAKVVLDALLANGIPAAQILIFDRTDELKSLLNLEVQSIKNDEALLDLEGLFHIAMGDLEKRIRIYHMLKKAGKIFASIIHPAAHVSPFSYIGTGSFIAAGSIIAANAKIGESCIINHNAVVDHEVKIDELSHIAPGTILGGKVCIGKACLIGSGASILPDIEIGDRVIVGSGAVVTQNITSGSKVMGIPAKSFDKTA